MSLYETLLFFHVLGAFSLVAGTTAMAPFAFGWGQVALERAGAARLALTGAILSGVGAVLTIVLGLWLVSNVGYQFFRLWILGALVLWAIAGYCNGEVASTARKVGRGEDEGRDVRILWAVDVVAVVRPNSWNLPLYFHIAGAMLLVGSLVVALFALAIARRRGDQPATAFAARVLFLGTLPAFIVMRVFAQIMVSKEHLDNSNASWLGVGFSVSDGGFLFLIITLILVGLMARRAKRGQSVAGALPLRISGVLMGILLVALVVAVWAMTTKPS
jgi:uncharacterized membrane protein